MKVFKKVFIDITNEFMKVANEYHIGVVKTQQEAGEKIGTSASNFNINYKKWCKINNINPKKYSENRWENEDGTLSDFGKKILNEIESGAKVSEVLKKYKTSSTMYQIYKDDME